MGEGCGELMVDVGPREVVGLPGAGGQEHGQDGADSPPTPVEDPWAALFVGSLLWALVSVLVAIESANAGMRRRVGLGCSVRVRLASGSVLLRKVSVTTCGGGRIFLSGGPDPVGPVRSHTYRTSHVRSSKKFAPGASRIALSPTG